MVPKPFLSVIIPTLNEEQMLPKLLSTLAVQSYRNFEVIVVDGKSTDKTISAAKKFLNHLPSLRIYTSDKKNVSIQRNLGGREALGKYLVFFDADVQVPRNFLRAIVSRIEKKKSILLTTWIKPSSHDSEALVMVAVTNIGSEAAKIIERPFAGGYNTIVLKSVFEHMGGFNPAVFHGEDHDFTIRCFDAGIKLDILKNPRLIYSTRRFEKYGYFSIIKKDTRSAVYNILKKPITKAIFDYPMGGEIYNQKFPMTSKNATKLESSLLASVRKFLSS
jgi:glycosyltransferase involved in cell wall biosynthesis